MNDANDSQRKKIKKILLICLGLVLIIVFVVTLSSGINDTAKLVNYQGVGYSISHPNDFKQADRGNNSFFSNAATEADKESKGSFIVSKLFESGETNKQALAKYGQKSKDFTGKVIETEINGRQVLFSEPAARESSSLVRSTYYITDQNTVWKISFAYEKDADKFANLVTDIVASFNPST